MANWRTGPQTGELARKLQLAVELVLKLATVFELAHNLATGRGELANWPVIRAVGS